MLPPHRPATASTSNPIQMPSTGAVGIALRTPEPSPRIRKDVTAITVNPEELYLSRLFDFFVWHRSYFILDEGGFMWRTEFCRCDDVRIGVGRHRDKLELIRDSLRPFEQACNTDSSSTQAHYNNNVNAEDETRLRTVKFDNASMRDCLLLMGFELERHNCIRISGMFWIIDEEAAMLALQLVRFSSVAAAAEVLLNINKDHVFQQVTSTKVIINFCSRQRIFAVSNYFFRIVYAAKESL
uniref:Uncharacterized protein n=1 Tax=Parascaris equorum TaxID=6256 RepID=A0A914RN84_PAREQ